MASFSPPLVLVERFRRDFEALAGDDCAGLGVAVSGGPDSMALLLLAHAAYPGRVRAATVDHGLRAESVSETALVGRHCAVIGVPHEILAIKVMVGGSGLQASARDARYRALGLWLASKGMTSLLTAHHIDDQAETLIMRLLRGSGVAGLAGVRARIPFPAAGENAFILRPLLGWRRSELAATVDNIGLETVQDPSNKDEAFDRARIRRQLAENPWLDPVSLAHSAAALAEAEESLEAATRFLAAERIERGNGGVLLRPDALPNELLRRLILYSLRLVVPTAAPRGEQLTVLIEQLRGGKVVTLAGVKCSGGRRFLFEPAPPRRR
jgi:tRNA(Ile)-lysidine synthase